MAGRRVWKRGQGLNGKREQALRKERSKQGASKSENGWRSLGHQGGVAGSVFPPGQKLGATGPRREKESCLKQNLGGQQGLYQQRSSMEVHGGGTAGPKGTAPRDAGCSKAGITTADRPEKEVETSPAKVMLSENR